MSIRFTWDSKKAIRNQRVHNGVTFEEAATVFRDPTAYIFDDDTLSDEEYRELIIGYSAQSRLLYCGCDGNRSFYLAKNSGFHSEYRIIVSFTERSDVIRIISARKADAGEQRDYERAKR